MKRLVAAVLLLAGCAGGGTSDRITLRFWAMGREGEVVQELVRDFERDNPNVRVIVQQIPWSSAHEKLLTSYVGRSWPDITQLGNTWVSEFSALKALEPLDRLAGTSLITRDGDFGGVWDTNVIDGTLYGIPWYVDTRVMFYRRDLLAKAGYDSIPQSWDEWRAAMAAIKRQAGKDRYAIFLPTNEWTQPAILGLQAGSSLLADQDTRGDFENAPFRRAFDFYLSLYRDGYAPALNNVGIANVYQEFERGTFAMYITGPWNVGEFRNRLAPGTQWATAPLPGPTGAASGVSLAGGSSLVLYRESKHKAEAWKLIEYLSRTESQVRFSHLSGDLPARRAAWRDSSLVGDPALRAFETQLTRVVPTPKIPEWEEIATRLLEQSERAIRGAAPPETTLAALDRDVDKILETRRWLVERARQRGVTAAR